MVIDKHTSSYIVDPYHILHYNCKKTNGEDPVIRVGKHCSIAHNCTFVLSHHDMTRLSTCPTHSTMLWKHGKGGNPSSFSRGDIIIEHDVWIGANVTIMDNVTIHSGSVVAAGSVVTKDVMPYTVVGGNPAKFIKHRFTPAQIEALLKIKWWDMEESKVDKFTTNIDEFIAMHSSNEMN